MKKIILLGLIISLLLIVGCTTGEKGTLVMQITDAPAELNIEKAMVTISEVQVHIAGSGEAEAEVENELTGAETAEVETIAETEESEDVEEVEEKTAGWFTIVSEAQTFDLMELVGVADVLGSADLEEGKYTQVRLTLDSALITIDGEEFDLTVPSGKIKLVKGFDIVAGETTTLTLDFDAQESVIATGAGDYKLKPTIKILSEEEFKGKSEEAGKPEETGAPEDKGKPEGVGQ